MGRTCLVSWMLMGIGVGAFGCSGGEVPIGTRNGLDNQGGAAGSGASTTSAGSSGSGGSGPGCQPACPAEGGVSLQDTGAPSQPGEGGNDGGDPRAKAATYARDDIACVVDSDCCLVTDGCRATALVVSAADKDTVASLIRSADMRLCVGCIAPFVQVSCKQGKCVGTSVDLQSRDAGDPDPRLTQDHCGTIDSPVAPKREGSTFSCGG